MYLFQSGAIKVFDVVAVKIIPGGEVWLTGLVTNGVQTLKWQAAADVHVWSVVVKDDTSRFLRWPGRTFNLGLEVCAAAKAFI